MPKVRTFNPRSPKPVRDNQNRKTPLSSGIFHHIENFTIQEVSPATQVHKLLRHKKKMERRIHNLIERRTRFPSQAEELMVKQKRAEAEYAWAVTRMTLLERRIGTQEKRIETTKKNKEESEIQYKKNQEKQTAFLAKTGQDGKIFVQTPRLEYKRAGRNGMSLKPKRMKRFSKK